MNYRYAILVLLCMPLLAQAQDLGGAGASIVGQSDSALQVLPVLLAQQNGGASIDTHELSKKIGGIAVLAVIALIVILAAKGKKPK